MQGYVFDNGIFGFTFLPQIVAPPHFTQILPECITIIDIAKLFKLGCVRILSSEGFHFPEFNLFSYQLFRLFVVLIESTGEF